MSGTTDKTTLYFLFASVEVADEAKHAWWNHEIETMGRMKTWILDEMANGVSQLSAPHSDAQQQNALMEFLKKNYAGHFLISTTPRVDASVEALFRGSNS